MIRYQKKIHIQRTATGAYTITGDRMAVKYKTTPIVALNDKEPIRAWWERQHHSDLREWQKDMLIRHIPTAFKHIDWQWQLTPYIVYLDGNGYNQPHDIVFARLEHPEETNTVYLLGTGEHTWIHHESKSIDSFMLHTEDAMRSVGTAQGRQSVWQVYDELKKIGEAST